VSKKTSPYALRNQGGKFSFGKSQRGVCLPTIKEGANPRPVLHGYSSLNAGVKFAMASRNIDMQQLSNSQILNSKVYRFM